MVTWPIWIYDEAHDLDVTLNAEEIDGVWQVPPPWGWRPPARWREQTEARPGVTIKRPPLRPGEGQHGCFLADRCVNDLRCHVRSVACHQAGAVVQW
ncbi:hypothetical protein [Micromonospora tarensis]|uniref:Uncharacterized protein n=1 Tax=Micromonospora tarensis TaxID=2806100 RepID=A0ABS1Y9S2_9ACTN|nr:hypothetical protein [Micromonospora tarensis]MBM0274125.1 hypothetical protein [Micromonospora tarensis]